MRNIKDIIVERLILSKTKSNNNNYIDIDNVTWDEFMDNFSKMNNPDIDLVRLPGASSDKFFINTTLGSHTVLGTLNGKQVTEFYKITGPRRGINIKIKSKLVPSLSLRSMEDLIDTFGKDQLSEIYNYILNHAGN